MAKAVKVGDTGTAHDGFPPTPVTAGSPDVKIDGIPAARVGDSLAPHSKPKHPPHGRSISSGSSTVLINGKPAALTGGSISCGGVTIGSGTVNIGDAPSSSSVSRISPLSSKATQAQMDGAQPHSSQRATSSQSAESAKIAPAASAPNTQIPQESAGYWPPYDFTKSEYLKVEYTQKAVDLAVMSLEEAEEFANNLWKEHNGKDTLDNAKKIWDGAANARDAYALSKGLGGMGVVAYTKVANGTEYVIIKGYKKHLKTLMRGHRWRANNPQVVQLGLGTKNMARNMLRVGLVVDIIFAIAINAVDVFVHDEKTMEDFVGRSGADIAKGMIATGAGTVIAVVATAVGLPLVVAGLSFAIVTLGASFLLDDVDSEYGISDKVVEKLKEVDV
jgi:uncharacterized Zn-binding protein involved in type VI secretion/3D (Asp-Asp-Asp) domain-containing protein